MNQIWNLNLDIVLEWYELLNELQTSLQRELTIEQTEKLFLEFMNIKGIKPSGNTELTKDELIKEIASKGKSILNIDKDGYSIIERKEDEL